MKIGANDILTFIIKARRLSLKTPTQGRPFECEADATALYIKNSQGNARRISRGDLEAFCKEYSKTGARTASHYSSQSFNASYLLAIIDALEAYTKHIAKE
jgi:hypothetical protein